MMKNSKASVICFGVACVMAGCGSSPERTASSTPAMEARVSTTQATPEIAAAECDREMKCNNVGSSLEFSSLEHCRKVKTDKITQDFNDDTDCKNGIATKQLHECVAKTTEQTCDGLSSVVSNAERASQCGSNDLCMN